jgi:hypothetical protein
VRSVKDARDHELPVVWSVRHLGFDAGEHIGLLVNPVNLRPVVNTAADEGRSALFFDG